MDSEKPRLHLIPQSRCLGCTSQGIVLFGAICMSCLGLVASQDPPPDLDNHSDLSSQDANKAFDCFGTVRGMPHTSGINAYNSLCNQNR